MAGDTGSCCNTRMGGGRSGRGGEEGGRRRLKRWKERNGCFREYEQRWTQKPPSFRFLLSPCACVRACVRFCPLCFFQFFRGGGGKERRKKGRKEGQRGKSDPSRKGGTRYELFWANFFSFFFFFFLFLLFFSKGRDDRRLCVFFQFLNFNSFEFFLPAVES